MEPYATSVEHALAELERIDLFIRLQVLRARQLKQSDDPFQGLYITDEEVDSLTSAPAGLPRWARTPPPSPEVESVLERLARTVAARTASSAARGIRLRLPELSRRFALTAFDADALLVCLAPGLDLRYERLFAYLQDDVTKRRPSVDLVLNLLAGSFLAKLEAQARFSPSAPLMRHRLVELVEDPAHPRAPLLGRYLKLDERILRFVLGSDEIDASLWPYATIVTPVATATEALSPEARALVAHAAGVLEARHRLLLSLQGPRSVGKRNWAEALCSRVGLALLVVDGEALVAAHPESFDATVRLLSREAVLQDAALYFGGFDALLRDDRRAHRRALSSALAESAGLSFVAGSLPWEPERADDGGAFARVELRRPDHPERERLWASSLGRSVAPEVLLEIPALAAMFRFTSGEIRAAVASATERARWQPAGDDRPAVEDLYAGCRAQSNPKLGELARKVRPHHTWDELVLPAGAAQQLREICGRVRHRPRVLEAWGFERKLALGKGLNALFAGPSGTGKTMAAGIMAAELGLDLYKIDLSSMVSKYIGETEKNLARVFAEAETTSAILFFDEADALFGKRSEVKDAHDRYANVETSYLLQRMEEYDGISILATNLRRNMDDAFVRRIAFVVQFPLPEEPERLRIWRGAFPEATQRGDDIDLPFMAKQFKLAGGDIKNVVLAAAFLAAADGGVVLMRHIVHATKRELQKMGRRLVAAELGPYASMMEDANE